MKIFNILLVPICAILNLILMLGCSSSETPESSDAAKAIDAIVEVEDPNQKEMEEFYNNLPEKERSELKLKRQIGLNLVKYIKLEGRSYRLDISENEAKKLGITPKQLQQAKDEIEDTNLQIAKMEADGEVLDLPNPHEFFKNKK